MGNTLDNQFQFLELQEVIIFYKLSTCGILFGHHKLSKAVSYRGSYCQVRCHEGLPLCCLLRILFLKVKFIWCKGPTSFLGLTQHHMLKNDSFGSLLQSLGHTYESSLLGFLRKLSNKHVFYCTSNRNVQRANSNTLEFCLASQKSHSVYQYQSQMNQEQPD